jgi:hypothetical protein
MHTQISLGELACVGREMVGVRAVLRMEWKMGSFRIGKWEVRGGWRTGCGFDGLGKG